MIEKRVIANDMLLEDVNSLLSEGKRVKIHAKGRSMNPFIQEVDIIVLAPPEKIVNGDIVLARIENKRYVLHRIIKKKNDIVWLMGDGNLFGSEQCSLDNILGVAESIIRNGQKHSLRSVKDQGLAHVWRMLLPFRRMAWKLKHLFTIC